VARKKKKKKAAKRKAVASPTLKMAMQAVQAKKAKGGCSQSEWHALSSIEGSLRKLGA
jgi:hypothetical protein